MPHPTPLHNHRTFKYWSMLRTTIQFEVGAHLTGGKRNKTIKLALNITIGAHVQQ